MKNSNKIFFGAFAFLGLLCLITLLFIRASLLPFDGVIGNGEITKVERIIPPFTELAFDEVDVILSQGASPLTLEGESNILEFVETKVEDGRLWVGPKDNNSYRSSKRLKAYIGVENLQSLQHNGVGSITSKDTLRVDDLSIQLTGSGNMDLTLIANNLSTQVNGVGDIKLQGFAQSLDALNTGAGLLDAPDFQVQRASINCSGVGNAIINAVNELNINISGVGNVDYKGNPRINQNISGMGKVRGI